jgi:small subunit ribosomal protein S18
MAKARAPKRSAKDAPRRGKKKVCVFCSDKIEWVDYKDVNLLRRFQSDRGKIRARRVTGNCNQHQAAVSVAIKTARELALLPYTQRTVTESRERRGGGRGSRPRDDEAPAAEAAPSGAEAAVGVPVGTEAGGGGDDE